MKKEKEPALQSWVCVELERGRGNSICKSPEVGKTLGPLQNRKNAPVAGITDLEVTEIWYSAWHIGRTQWRLALTSFPRDEKSEEPGKQRILGKEGLLLQSLWVSA